jgi:myo-inositol 2-dehydrogenase / D-chiro-inositol 1-dehydrogenase
MCLSELFAISTRILETNESIKPISTIMGNNNFSRRKFITGAAVVGAAGLGGFNPLTACSDGSSNKLSQVTGKPFKGLSDLTLPPLLETAPDGPVLKAGVIGCGGRGSGAAINWLSAGPNVTITALGDVFKDRLDSCREKINKQFKFEVPPENCFVGFDAYQKVIDSGVDVVILATPPKFRPAHFEAAVNARKHVFMEKPVAVDPVGIRSVIASAKKAESLNLKIVTGTQRRHQRDYLEVYKLVATGTIGDIVSANAYWNQSQLWFRNPEAGWSEMESMIRDWVNWLWLSGDHIVEQHVHNLDVINWFTGQYPVKAVGFGSRQRRVTGDQYDNFSVDFVYDNGMQMHSMCRQINGCASNVSEMIHGSKGITNCRNSIWDLAGNELYAYPYVEKEKPRIDYPFSDDIKQKNAAKVQNKKTEIVPVSVKDPYVQEHTDLITCIRQDKPVNEAEGTAMSCLVAIMGRVSAYTGKMVTLEEMMNSDLKLGPETFVMGNVGIMKNPVIPVPGEANK